jgi:hypothetical protein
MYIACGLPDRYVITFKRLMSPLYYQFVFNNIQDTSGGSPHSKRPSIEENEGRTSP